MNVEADDEAFERELGVTVAPSLVAAPKPRDHALSDLIDLVEIAGEPIPLAKG